GAVGHDPGRQLQAQEETRLSHGADPPPLRAQGLGRAEDHRAVLDRVGAACAHRARHVEIAMKLEGKKVLVVGLARSGVAAAGFWAWGGGGVPVTARARGEKLVEPLAKLAGCARLELGGHRAESFLGADLIVMSPGVPELPETRAARAAGVEVIAEI